MRNLHKTIMPRDTKSIHTYFKEVSSFPLLCAEEEKELATRIQEGDKEALNTLITSNLRYVISLAKPFQDYGLCIEDLIEYGNLGLIEAANRFDPSFGYRFTTYASPWIRKSLLDAVCNKSRTVRMPQHLVEQYNKISRFCNKFEQEEMRMPTTQEIAETFGMTINQVAHLLEGSFTISLGTPLNNDAKSGTVEDILENNDISTPDDECDKSITYASLHKSVSMLPDRERRVINMLYPLDNSIPYSVEQVCEALSLTRESIRLIKNRALKHLRNQVAA